VWVSDLVDVFIAAWGGGEAPEELGTLLADICAQAHADQPDLAFEDRDLVAAIGARCPREEVVAYLGRCRGGDLALARAAGRGDPAAIAALEQAHQRTIKSTCQRFTSATHTAEDLRQLLREKLFVAPAASIQEYAGQGRLDTWIRVTATRLFLDLGKRKDRVREVPATDSGVAEIPHPADLGLEMVKLEYRSAVLAAIEHATSNLDPGDRLVLRQHFVEGLTIDQIAAAIGIHRSTAARRIAKAREQLSTLVREQLAAKLAIAPGKLDEIFGLVVSRLDVSIGKLLATQS
jgi:RNA polymerase sigma-70 factor (ECF subfamily)